MVINILSSAETLSVVKVAALRALAKVGNSPLLTNKAYKAGSTILPKLSEDGFLPILLISLSKLASRSIVLSSKQVTLLCELLAQDLTTHTQMVALRCIFYVVDRSPHASSGISSFIDICRILDEPTTSSALRCEGLQIFVQVISNKLHSAHLLNIHNFEKLLRTINNSASSQLMYERIIAFQALVDILIRVKGCSKTVHEVSFLPHLPDIIQAIGKEITVLTAPLPEQPEHPPAEQHLKSFLALLLIIVERCPDLSLLVLDNISSLLTELRDMLNNDRTASDVHKIIEVEEATLIFPFSRQVLHICKFLAASLKKLAASDDITTEVVSKVKHMVCIVCQSGMFSCRVHLSFSMLLPLCSCLGRGALRENSRNGDVCNLDMKGILVGKCLHNMLESPSSYWSVYLTGISASCEGIWSVAHPIFEQLAKVVNSDIFHVWLSSLSQFAHLEKSIQVIFLQEYCSHFLNEGNIQSVRSENTDILTMGSIQVLVDACDGLRSSQKMLGIDIMPRDIFCFKRWFLALRLKVLEAVIRLLKFLCGTAEDKGSMSVADVLSKLKRIADEYDLMAATFTNRERKSQKVISSLALGCSLLALCTGFYSLGESFGDCGGNRHQTTLIQDLVWRLQDTDSATCTSILSLLKEDAKYQIPSHSYARFNFHNAGPLLRVCQQAVKGIVNLQNGSTGMDDENTTVMMEYKRRQFLLDVIIEWFRVPFQIPKSFFQQSPSVGSALFCQNANGDKRHELSVIKGSHLSLNLCLQLKNMPPDTPSSGTRIFCILHCTSTRVEPDASTDSFDHRAWTTDIMMLLHKKLQWYIYNEITSGLVNVFDNDDSNVAESCVFFETTGSAQVYSSCLLDVSSFPAGSYRVHWLSCYVDRDGSFWSLLPMNSGPTFTVT